MEDEDYHLEVKKDSEKGFYFIRLEDGTEVFISDGKLIEENVTIRLPKFIKLHNRITHLLHLQSSFRCSISSRTIQQRLSRTRRRSSRSCSRCSKDARFYTKQQSNIRKY